MSTFKQNPDVIIRYEGDKALAFHQGNGWICIMNPTSLFIWEHCTGEYTSRQIAELLQERFDMSQSSFDLSELVEIVEQHLNLLYRGGMVESINHSDLGICSDGEVSSAMESDSVLEEDKYAE